MDVHVVSFPSCHDWSLKSVGRSVIAILILGTNLKHGNHVTLLITVWQLWLPYIRSQSWPGLCSRKDKCTSSLLLFLVDLCCNYICRSCLYFFPSMSDLLSDRLWSWLLLCFVDVFSECTCQLHPELSFSDCMTVNLLQHLITIHCQQSLALAQFKVTKHKPQCIHKEAVVFREVFLKI